MLPELQEAVASFTTASTRTLLAYCSPRLLDLISKRFGLLSTQRLLEELASEGAPGATLDEVLSWPRLGFVLDSRKVLLAAARQDRCETLQHVICTLQKQELMDGMMDLWDEARAAGANASPRALAVLSTFALAVLSTFRESCDLLPSYFVGLLSGGHWDEAQRTIATMKSG